MMGRTHSGEPKERCDSVTFDTGLGVLRIHVTEWQRNVGRAGAGRRTGQPRQNRLRAKRPSAAGDGRLAGQPVYRSTRTASTCT
jgi:hypothetical protein